MSAGYRLGGSAVSHGHHAASSTEAEYDRLRDAARREAERRNDCFDRAHRAYESGDGAAAHEISQEGHRHAAKMDELNKQASDYIFRENNAPGRVADDAIDLHGQFVDEAEHILQTRIEAARQQNQSHLHVIVGKGNHSVDHVQKLKPAVEKLCRENGLDYATEENAGRIYINLKGERVDTIPPPPSGYPGSSHHPRTQQHSRPPRQEMEYGDDNRDEGGLAGCLKGCCSVM